MCVHSQPLVGTISRGMHARLDERYVNMSNFFLQGNLAFFLQGNVSLIIVHWLVILHALGFRNRASSYWAKAQRTRLADPT